MPRNHNRSDSVTCCVVCCEDIEIFAIGLCDHPICYVCSVRMRVLGKEKYCAVCRTDLDKVILTKKCAKWASLQDQIKHGYTEKQSGMCYADKDVRNKVNELLQFKCPKCLDQPPERTFNKLRDHLKREHHLYYCDICLKHLQKFTHELKVYSRADLAKHRRVGDSEDTAYKGHPLCEFCDDRFLDDEDLHRHLRKNHFWCHICEKDGKQLYFQDYVNLRVHFKEEHYLCEEDMCKYEQYTSVFRSDIDLQAHVASKHSQKMSKAQVRQARQLDVDLVFNPRPSAKQGRNITGQDYSEVRGNDQKFRRDRGKGRNGLNNRQEDQNIQAALEMSVAKKEQNKQPLQQNKEGEKSINEDDHPKLLEDDFPKLNGAVSNPKGNSPKASPNSTRKAEAFNKKARGLVNHEDFPTLGNPSKTKQNEAGTNTQSSIRLSPKSKRNPKPESFNKKTRGLGSLEDFPVLGKPSKTQQNGTNNDVKVNNGGTKGSPEATRKPEASNKKNKAVEPQEDFPILGKPSKPQQNGVATDTQSNNQISTKTSQKPEALNEKSKPVENLGFRSSGKPTKMLQNGTGTDVLSTTKVSTTIAQKPEASDNKNKAVNNLQDFPSLGKPLKAQLKNPPPGFVNVVKEPSEPAKIKSPTEQPTNKPLKAQLKNPPPGFANVVKEPSEPAKIKSPTEQPTNNPDFTKPSGKNEEVPLPKKEESAVMNNEKKDKTNQQRNQSLIENIKALLEYDTEKFVEFKTISGKFRQGQCSAEMYYSDCTDLFGPSFALIFSELVTLLPDKEKQKELLRVHNDTRVLTKQSGKSMPETTGKKLNSLNTAWGPLQSNVAPTKKEASQKTRNDVDFPSLPPAAPRQMKPARMYKPTTNLALKSAWVRGK